MCYNIIWEGDIKVLNKIIWNGGEKSMNKKEIIKGVIINAVIAVITTFLMMLILKVSITLGNFSVLFIISIIMFIIGNLIFLIK